MRKGKCEIRPVDRKRQQTSNFYFLLTSLTARKYHFLPYFTSVQRYLKVIKCITFYHSLLSSDNPRRCLQPQKWINKQISRMYRIAFYVSITSMFIWFVSLMWFISFYVHVYLMVNVRCIKGEICHKCTLYLCCIASFRSLLQLSLASVSYRDAQESSPVTAKHT